MIITMRKKQPLHHPKKELTAIIGSDHGEKNMNSKRARMAALHMSNSLEKALIVNASLG